MGVVLDHLDLNHRVARAVKVQMTNEGREAQAKEQEVIQRKRKAEDDKVWEGMCLPPSLLYEYTIG